MDMVINSGTTNECGGDQSGPVEWIATSRMRNSLLISKDYLGRAVGGSLAAKKSFSAERQTLRNEAQRVKIQQYAQISRDNALMKFTMSHQRRRDTQFCMP